MNQSLRWGERKKLPQSAKGYRLHALVGNHKVVLHTAEYRDGTLGEISIDMPKAGVAVRGLLAGFSQAVTFALQHGASLEELAETFLYTRFEPSGTVLEHAQIGSATSIIDFVFRDLAIHYLGRKDLVQPTTSSPEPSGGQVVSFLHSVDTPGAGKK